MRDPWKYAAFPAAAMSGYLLSYLAISATVGEFVGLPDYALELLVVASTGLAAGFIVDDLVPAYLEKTRGGGAGELGGDIGGDMDEGDFDFD